jgi:hypothetical protein
VAQTRLISGHPSLITQQNQPSGTPPFNRRTAGLADAGERFD